MRKSLFCRKVSKEKRTTKEESQLSKNSKPRKIWRTNTTMRRIFWISMREWRTARLLKRNTLLFNLSDTAQAKMNHVKITPLSLSSVQVLVVEVEMVMRTSLMRMRSWYLQLFPSRSLIELRSLKGLSPQTCLLQQHRLISTLQHLLRINNNSKTKLVSGCTRPLISISSSN
jgi:hypothetical protein